MPFGAKCWATSRVFTISGLKFVCSPRIPKWTSSLMSSRSLPGCSLPLFLILGLWEISLVIASSAGIRFSRLEVCFGTFERESQAQQAEEHDLDTFRLLPWQEPSTRLRIGTHLSCSFDGINFPHPQTPPSSMALTKLIHSMTMSMRSWLALVGWSLAFQTKFRLSSRWVYVEGLWISSCSHSHPFKPRLCARSEAFLRAATSKPKC